MHIYLNADVPFAHSPQPGDSREVVLISTPGSSKRAERMVRSLGHSNFHCYVDEMDQLDQDRVVFPKIVSFEVLYIVAIQLCLSVSADVVDFQSLRLLLEEDRVLLVDVRNRTELNTVGQIPGSVCLPLHEVDAAFQDLSEKEFLQRYGSLSHFTTNT